MKHPKYIKSAFITTLITYMIFFNYAFSNDLVENLDERLVSAMQIANLDIISIEIQTKSLVADDALPHTLNCVHESTDAYLKPLYVEELNKLFTQAEKNIALSFYESSAWKKSWETQINFLLEVFGGKARTDSSSLSLSPNEELEIEQFASSDLGKRFFTFITSQDQNDRRILQINRIKENCVGKIGSDTITSATSGAPSTGTSGMPVTTHENRHP